MRKNRVREIWAEGKAAINGWLHIPSAWSAEIMANQDWDSLVIDMQHGMMGMETAIIMLQAISTTDTVPMARVTWNTPGDIMRLLDAGAYGIVCPMIETRQQCEAFVGACRYPPDGYRSLGPTRARVHAGEDYADHANETVLTFAMVETQLGYDNRDEILSVPGLDAVFIGGGDLRLSMTAAGGAGDDAMLDAAVNDILATAKAHGKKAGIFCPSPDYAIDMIGRGFDLVTVMTETAMMSSAAQHVLSTVRGQSG